MWNWFFSVWTEHLITYFILCILVEKNNDDNKKNLRPVYINLTICKLVKSLSPLHLQSLYLVISALTIITVLQKLKRNWNSEKWDDQGHTRPSKIMCENDFKSVKILVQLKKWKSEDKKPFALLNRRKTHASQLESWSLPKKLKWKCLGKLFPYIQRLLWDRCISGHSCHLLPSKIFARIQSLQELGMNFS